MGPSLCSHIAIHAVFRDVMFLFSIIFSLSLLVYMAISTHPSGPSSIVTSFIIITSFSRQLMCICLCVVFSYAVISLLWLPTLLGYGLLKPEGLLFCSLTSVSGTNALYNGGKDGK